MVSVTVYNKNNAMKKGVKMRKLIKVCIIILAFCAIACLGACNENTDPKKDPITNVGGETEKEECLHEFEEKKENYVAPTCASIGEKFFACKKCGTTKRETIAKLPHSEVELLDEVDGDCTHQGYQVYACLECGENYAIYTEAKWHTPNGEGTVHAAECLTDGYTEYECKVCGEHYKTNWQMKIGHAYGEIEETVKENCSHIGYTVRICGNCGDRLVEKTADKLKHDFSKGDTCTSCGIGKEAVWVTYGGSLDSVEYADGTYIINSEKDGKILHIEAEAVRNFIESGCNKILVAFDKKDNQETAFNAQFNGVDNECNTGFNFSITLTEEMKTEGVDIMMYYHTRGWSTDVEKDETDGFLFSVAGIKAFNEANKESYFVWDNMSVSYNEESNTWIFTPNENTPMTGYHHPCFSKDMIEKYKAEGKTKLTLTIGTVNREQAGIQFDIPQCSAANIGGVYPATTTVEIDLNSLPTNGFFSVDGYFAMRCYVNGEIKGLTIAISVS